jgi:AcrR family transcriptional regulator
MAPTTAPSEEAPPEAVAATVRPTGRVGRPPRIDREAIAAAVLDIGLERASMKAVAEHLGVSVPGLYHHVRNRKELLLLAAERSLARVRLPEDRGQHWSEWLREWSRYSRASLVDDPELFNQYLSGALSWDSMVDVIDSVLRVLTRQGFPPLEAKAAWDAVGRVALGSVADTIRQRAAAESGRPRAAELHRILARRDRDALAGVRAVADWAPHPDEEFEVELTTLLVGIAVRRGEPWAAIAAASPEGPDGPVPAPV